MSCVDFERLIVSDEPVERDRAARHAAGCEACAAVLAAHRRVAEHAAEWGQALEAPAALENRVRQVLAGAQTASTSDTASPRTSGSFRPREGRILGRPGAWSRRWTRRLAIPAALAASLLTAVAIGWPLVREAPAPEVTRRLLAAEALKEARAAEKEHARAIARLEIAAAPLLERARNPETDPEDVGRLLVFADRLAFLDSTIEQVAAYIDDNPSHPQARTTLLAAYREKTEILSEILILETAS